MPLIPNTRIGPYEILAPLGAGGMGEVYRARDTRLVREVAIKVLPAHLTHTPEFKQRFDREAKAISQLTHPHVCTLYDVGHWDGTDYLVMELLEGETLAHRLTKSALPLEAALKHGVEIASALHAAHRKGVVHRDLKPANVMLTKTGAKLLDFGLAKSVTILDTYPNAVTVTQPLTSKGTILGTYQYMAPEQLEGGEADERTDIFTLGAVLYEMMTGKRAFEGVSRASLIAAIMTSQPRPLIELQPLTPPVLDRLLRKCLAKDPDARWQSAADVADELRWIAESGPPGEGMIDAPRRLRRLTLAGWVTAAILGGTAMTSWVFRSVPESAKPVHLSAMISGAEVVDAGVENLAIALSPDGQSLAYCAKGVDGIHLYVRRLDQRKPIKIAGTAGAYDPFFSPDGEWIGFFSGSKLYKVSIRGGASIPLTDAMESRSATWVDGHSIVFSPTFSSPLVRVSASGGNAEPVTILDVEKRERSHRWPEVLPGGEWVLFTVGIVDSPGGYDDCAIEAVSLKTAERRVLVRGSRMARFAPPGYLIFARNDVLFAVALDPRDPKMSSSPLPVLDGVGGEDTSGASHFSVSITGTLAYIPASPDEFDEPVWIDMAGSVEPVGVPQRIYDQVRVSPDGTQLLLGSGKRARGDLWLYTLAGGRLTRITSDQTCTNAFWMPDRRRVVYRTEERGYHIKIQPIDGSQAPKVIYSDPDPVTVSDITPDGAVVLFHKYGNMQSDLMMVPTDGSAPARPLWQQPGSQFAGAVSPDGRWLAYTSRETGVTDVFVRQSSGEVPKWQVSVDGGNMPLWSPDGKELYFVQGSAMMAVSIESRDAQFAAGMPRKLFDFPLSRPFEHDTPSFDITPDGKRFVVIRTAASGSGRRQINVVLNWSQELQAKVPLVKP
jgi:serine/threonine-protein kinase